MAQLVECIPNFSEARRPEVVEQIIQAIQTVPEIILLDRHSDLDHNRTVLTFLGPPRQVEEAAFQAIATAARWIDLNEHRGEHPRIGATDVVPFVPISEVTMEDCIAIAQRLGQRVGQELNIPVYLYEEAAMRPDRKNLENIRRGQYEGLKTEIVTNPDRQPDYGPPGTLGKAGATVIGARSPLIAYNIYLTSDDVSIAQKIAKAVRNSSGGLRFVKAMGVMVDGRAQVSMNLTNFRKTPLARVVEFVRREAERYGVTIHHSELVGLIPQEAVVDTAVWYTQMDGFEPAQILESHIFKSLSRNTSLLQTEENNFLGRLASVESVPAGGSAAAHAAASAAALTAMVARLALRKNGGSAIEGTFLDIINETEELRSELTRAVEEDALAYSSYMAARSLPKDTPEQRTIRQAAVQRGIHNAILVPLHVAQTSIRLLELAAQMATLAHISAVADAGTAGSLAFAAFQAAAINVQTNLQGFEDDQLARQYQHNLTDWRQDSQKHQQELQSVLKQRLNIDL